MMLVYINLLVVSGFALFHTERGRFLTSAAPSRLKLKLLEIGGENIEFEIEDNLGKRREEGWIVTKNPNVVLNTGPNNTVRKFRKMNSSTENYTVILGPNDKFYIVQGKKCAYWDKIMGEVKMRDCDKLEGNLFKIFFALNRPSLINGGDPGKKICIFDISDCQLFDDGGGGDKKNPSYGLSEEEEERAERAAKEAGDNAAAVAEEMGLGKAAADRIGDETERGAEKDIKEEMKDAAIEEEIEDDIKDNLAKEAADTVEKKQQKWLKNWV